MNSTHLLSNTHLYRIFHGMKTRCYNKNTPAYLKYGAKGIKISKSWLNNYSLFHKWALDNGWERGLEIDRINYKGNYTPKNCRIVTKAENARNKGNLVYISYNGTNIPLCVLANRLGSDPKIFWQRYKKGWPIERIINTPISRKRTVAQFDVNYNLINIFPSANQAFKSTGISSKHIGDIAKGRCISTKGHIWIFLD